MLLVLSTEVLKIFVLPIFVPPCPSPSLLKHDCRVHSLLKHHLPPMLLLLILSIPTSIPTSPIFIYLKSFLLNYNIFKTSSPSIDFFFPIQRLTFYLRVLRFAVLKWKHSLLRLKCSRSSAPPYLEIRTLAEQGNFSSLHLAVCNR